MSSFSSSFKSDSSLNSDIANTFYTRVNDNNKDKDKTKKSVYRRTNIERQKTLTKIQELINAGYPEQAILEEVQLSKTHYDRYVRKLRTDILKTQLERRAEYFAQDVHIAKERLLLNKRYLMDLITDPTSTIRRDCKQLNLMHI